MINLPKALLSVIVVLFIIPVIVWNVVVYVQCTDGVIVRGLFSLVCIK